MREKSSSSNPCENAAVRVQGWFGKDKENLPQIIDNPDPSDGFSKKHKCDHVKTPQIPSQIEHLPIPSYDMSKKKKNAKQRNVTKENPLKPLKFNIDQAHCNINQKDLNHLNLDSPLSSNRVAQYRLKEHSVASKQLKTLSKEKHTGPKRHDIVRIHAKQNLSPNPHLEDWGIMNEERHFQIERVIKYLAD